MAHRAEPVENRGTEASPRNTWEFRVNVKRIVVSGEAVDVSLLFRDMFFDNNIRLTVRNTNSKVWARCAAILEASGAD